MSDARLPRVLLVDDQPLMRTLVCRTLRTICDVDVASNGEEALSFATRGAAYALILCDLRLPTISGEEVFRRLQQVRPELVDRFVAMTGAVGPIDPALAREHVRVLRKPFTREDLISLVRSYVPID